MTTAAVKTDLFHCVDSVRIILGRMPKSHARDEALALAETAVGAINYTPDGSDTLAAAIKAAYFEGFVAAAGGYAGENTAKQYAGKNWPYSQAAADAALAAPNEAQEAALRAASNELSRLLFNEPSQTTHKVIEVVDAALASTNGKHRNPS